jgi:hypothetical protein
MKMLSRERLLNDNEKHAIGTLWGELSRAIRTIAEDDVERAKAPGRVARPASAFYDKEYMNEWTGRFIETVRIARWLSLSRLSEKMGSRGVKGLALLDRILEN